MLDRKLPKPLNHRLAGAVGVLNHMPLLNHSRKTAPIAQRRSRLQLQRMLVALRNSNNDRPRKRRVQRLALHHLLGNAKLDLVVVHQPMRGHPMPARAVLVPGSLRQSPTCPPRKINIQPHEIPLQLCQRPHPRPERFRIILKFNKHGNTVRLFQRPAYAPSRKQPDFKKWRV